MAYKRDDEVFWDIVLSDFAWLIKKEDKSLSEYDQEILRSKRSKNSAQVVIPCSFYDLFVRPFSFISLFRHHTDAPDIDSYCEPKYINSSPVRADFDFFADSFRTITKIYQLPDDLITFYSIISKMKFPNYMLTIGRGNAFFIPRTVNEGPKTEGLDFEYIHNNWKESIQYILIQYETRSYGFLELKHTSKVNFDPSKHFFSFAVNQDNQFHKGDVFFFGYEGLEYSVKNVITIVNSYLDKNTKSTGDKFGVSEIGDIMEYYHQFKIDSVRTEITFFKETEYIYYIKIFENPYYARLKRHEVEVTVRINFFNDDILKLRGTKSLQSLK